MKRSAAHAVELRNTVKAVCRNSEKKVLVVVKTYEDGSEVYTLPGGSQNPGETLLEALTRECLEEIGCQVVPGQLLYVCEYGKPSGGPEKSPRHKVEFGFACSLPRDYAPHMGPKPDTHQSAVRWMSEARLAALNCSPAQLPRCLGEAAGRPIYMGAG